MKAQKPPTPAPDSTPQTFSTPAPDDTQVRMIEGTDWRGEYRRHIFSHYRPATDVEAKEILEESMSRAGALSSIVNGYAWHSEGVSLSDLRYALDLLGDLLFVGYEMLEYWEPTEGQP